MLRAICLLAGIVAVPCIWDSDTLDTELRGLPDAFDLTLGRWHRHSEAYYLQRVERLDGRSDLSLAEYDDLAVAHEHLGQRERAIEVMADKAALLLKQPDKEHQYRYHANLGTFYAHAGRYEEALHQLRTAITIEPAAHFGREIHQIEAIEYVVRAQAEPELWARRSFLREAGYDLDAFWLRACFQFCQIEGLDEAERASDFAGEKALHWQTAYRAVAGMLRFGGREGAELYRALGELLLQREHLNLAWFAFQHAIERGHPASDLLRAGLQAIERHWREARVHDLWSLHATPTIEQYRAARERTDRWVAAFQRLETEAIHAGRDVTAEATLRELLAAADDEVPRPSAPWTFSGPAWWGTGAALVAMAALLFARRRALRRRAGSTA